MLIEPSIKCVRGGGWGEGVNCIAQRKRLGFSSSSHGFNFWSRRSRFSNIEILSVAPRRECCLEVDGKKTPIACCNKLVLFKSKMVSCSLLFSVLSIVTKLSVLSMSSGSKKIIMIRILEGFFWKSNQ